MSHKPHARSPAVSELFCQPFRVAPAVHPSGAAVASHAAVAAAVARWDVPPLAAHVAAALAAALRSAAWAAAVLLVAALAFEVAMALQRRCTAQ